MHCYRWWQHHYQENVNNTSYLPLAWADKSWTVLNPKDIVRVNIQQALTSIIVCIFCTMVNLCFIYTFMSDTILPDFHLTAIVIIIIWSFLNQYFPWYSYRIFADHSEECKGHWVKGGGTLKVTKAPFPEVIFFLELSDWIVDGKFGENADLYLKTNLLHFITAVH